jgi:arylsulfatase A-like enzyme
MTKPLIFSFLLSLFVSVNNAADKPNVIVILTDDLGFSDPGCYGGEIETPNLDRLAAEGLRFTQFYNTAKCHSSRVSLLSGRWCMQAGDTKLSRAVTLPEVLQPEGYFTAMAGKWHLDKEPTDFGFERYFGHLSGACNYFTGDKTFRLNGKPWEVPASGFYTTVANVDHALGFLNEARTAEKPYFLYLAFNAPHAPLQPLEIDYQKYKGRYDAGWDMIREARLAKQKALGLFDESLAPSPRPENIPAWDSLSPEMQDWEKRRMTALAAMIDRVDQEIGRLVADLEKAGELDNTFILFLSDNGACPYDRKSTGIDKEPFLATTSWSDSTGWAWARNSPFRYYKQNQFEGGISSPAIVHWPAGLKTKAGAIEASPAHLVDVLPTIAEIAGADIPTTFPGRELSSLAGVSLTPIFVGKALESRPPIHLMFSSDRGLRDGPWKLVSFQSDPWELYHIASDRTELHNLSAAEPERVREMAAVWQKIAKEELRTNAPELPASEETPVSHSHREWTVYDSPLASSIRKGENKKSASTAQIRARKDTKLSARKGSLHLTCSGDDSGLAFQSLPGMENAKGPFRLTFEMKSDSSGPGEVYWTESPDTILPKGAHLVFEPAHSGEWETFALDLPVTKSLDAFRLDLSSAPGEIVVRKLTLTSADGAETVTWP